MAGTRRSRRQTEAAAPRARRRPAFAFATLFAVLLQAFVVQTHIHAPAAAALGVAVERADDGAAAQASVLDEHKVVACAVCQMLASGGGLLLMAAGTSLVEDHIGGEGATYALPRAPPIAAHPWQSRAPPQVLQA